MSGHSTPHEHEASIDEHSDRYTFGEQVGLYTISGALVAGAGLVWTGGENFVSAQQASDQESAGTTVTVADRDIQIPKKIDTFGSLILGASFVVGGIFGVMKLKSDRNN